MPPGDDWLGALAKIRSHTVFRRRAIVVLVVSLAAAARGQIPLPLITTPEDFFIRGSQHGTLDGNIHPSVDPITGNDICAYCHTSSELEVAKIHRHWSGSMMAQATRDPLFHACLQVAETDAEYVGDICIRCHSPKGWLEGRSFPTDASGLDPDQDYEGVSCGFCHRMVSITPDADEDCTGPPGNCDNAIRSALLNDPAGSNLPTQYGSGGYVVDTTDLRRGPFADAACFPNYHPFRKRTLFVQAQLCGTCHDVSNPAYRKHLDPMTSEVRYVLGNAAQPDVPSLDSRHPTGDKYEMFPNERTFSEWSQSAFATTPGGIDMGGRFGGNNRFVSTCQSCHMPAGLGDGRTLHGCFDVGNSPARLDVPMHYFNGANTWMPDVIANLHPQDPQVDIDTLMEGKGRSMAMLQLAATMQLFREPDGSLRVRVFNETGHKLPTGYSEGRRMWLRIVARDCNGALIGEFGHYDPATAVLTTSNTRVYEAEYGIDGHLAAYLNRPDYPAGPSFHFALNNKIFLDNRIPPRGFTNAGFASVQAPPVGYAYADGQYWDDTIFALAQGTATAEVSLHYQTASKEYVEFLRDHNPNPPDDPKNMGQIVYNQWLVTSKSPPVQMVAGTLVARPKGDLSGNGVVDEDDVALFVNVLIGMPGDSCAISLSDLNSDGAVDGTDVQLFINALL